MNIYELQFRNNTTGVKRTYQVASHDSMEEVQRRHVERQLPNYDFLGIKEIDYGE